jgi:hypothetical protein
VKNLNLVEMKAKKRGKKGIQTCAFDNLPSVIIRV